MCRISTWNVACMTVVEICWTCHLTCMKDILQEILHLEMWRKCIHFLTLHMCLPCAWNMTCPIHFLMESWIRKCNCCSSVPCLSLVISSSVGVFVACHEYFLEFWNLFPWLVLKGCSQLHHTRKVNCWQRDACNTHPTYETRNASCQTGWHMYTHTPPTRLVRQVAGVWHIYTHPTYKTRQGKLPDSVTYIFNIQDLQGKSPDRVTCTKKSSKMSFIVGRVLIASMQ